MLNFQEDLLHYVWKLKYFNLHHLQTTCEQEIQILHSGYHNYDAGPDFSEARLKIGEVEWNGNIEIHIHSSDWIKHKHQNDPSYDNIILHVVYMEDEEIFRKNGEKIPCLELKGRIHKKVFDKYHLLKGDKSWIACENSISTLPEFNRKLWYDKLIIDRLQRKCGEILQLLDMSRNNWEHAFYVQLGKYFGANINKEAFQQVCRSIDYKIVSKNKFNPTNLEALFFGQAGFLNTTFKDEYPNTLKKEYLYLKHKYKLEPIPVKNWKFFRLRPSAFPTFRMAQYIALIVNNTNLFASILEVNSVQELRDIFTFSLPPYWENHYRFDHPAKVNSTNIGNSFQNTIIINSIIPFIFLYGKLRDIPDLVERSIAFLSQIEPENNKIIKKWKSLVNAPENALESQALLQLKLEYCDKNRCLQCAIGHQLLKS